LATESRRFLSNHIFGEWKKNQAQVQYKRDRSRCLGLSIQS
jgi:hypothetical protein